MIIIMIIMMMMMIIIIILIIIIIIISLFLPGGIRNVSIFVLYTHFCAQTSTYL